jgi:hypothetical protein
MKSSFEMRWKGKPPPVEAFEPVAQLMNLCVWVKTNGDTGSLYRSRHRLVFVSGKPDAPRGNNVQLDKHARNRTNVWNYLGVNSSPRRGRTRGVDLHPTVKPIAMVATYRELSLKVLVDGAVNGDLAAAELALKIRAHA